MYWFANEQNVGYTEANQQSQKTLKDKKYFFSGKNYIFFCWKHK